jgi:hypothetical protein
VGIWVDWIESLEAAAFTKAENGYVYSATSLVGSSRHYLVNEAQKRAIIDRMVQTQKVLIPASFIMCLFVVGFVLLTAMSFKPDGTILFPIILSTVMVLAAFASMSISWFIYRMHKLRPLLGGLPPLPVVSREPLTWSVKLAATRLPLPLALGMGCFFVLGSLMQALLLTKTVQDAGPATLMILPTVLALMSAVLALFFFAVAYCKADRG